MDTKIVRAVTFAVWLALFAVAVSLVPAAAKERKDAKKAEAAPAEVGNFLDLRQQMFICGENGCAMPVQGILLGCNLQGCRPITDIIVSSGPVRRVSPQIPK